MSRLGLIPLRVLLPVLLLSSAGTAGLIAWQLNTRLLGGEIEAQFLEEEKLQITSLQSTLEYLFRKGDLSGVRLEVSGMATRKDVLAAFVIDEQGRIVAATRYAAINQTAHVIKSELPEELRNQHASSVAEVIASKKGKLLLSRDRFITVAYYPLLVKIEETSLRPIQNGLVVLVMDMHQAKARAFQAAGRQALDYALLFGGIAALAWGFIHFGLTRRVAGLVATTRQLAAGDLSARTGIAGGDELAQVAKAIDAMATQIAADIQKRERVEAELANRTSALAHSFSLLHATLESTADGILATQFASGVNCANTKFRGMWGIPPEMLERGDESELIAFMAPQTRHPEQFIARLNELVANPDDEYFDVIELQDGRTFERYCHPQRIAGKTEGLVINFRDITERRRVERELTDAHRQLVATARQAGMAEVAVNVLHNVGNVLNSVNVSANLVSSRVHSSKAQGLSRAVQLLNAHAADLGEFLTRDEKGKLLPDYLNKVAAALAAEQQSIIAELGQLTKSVDHIKEIVSAQQSHAGASRVVEAVQIRDLLEDALRMNSFSFSRHRIEVVKEFAEVPELRLDKARLLQILVNLIRNAKQAMAGVDGRPHQMTLRVNVTDERKLRICVQDQGEGIAAENLTRIFSHGFTTRKDGHGFGLHSCVLAAKEMGGRLTAHSDGPGKGAAFTLELPIREEEAL
ncbi:MAG TPA: ATP-binding protein [Terriglobales bacterium]|nr:ATP-binding protein [Terriglobales bacterium]